MVFGWFLESFKGRAGGVGEINVPLWPKAGYVFQRDPEVVLGPSVLLEARGTTAKKPHIFKENDGLLDFPPDSGRNRPNSLGK